MLNDFDPITQDPSGADFRFPPGFVPFSIPARDGQPLLARCLLAQGRGPNPLAIFLHGYPGNEQNFDLAHLVRRSGWNALIFSYRGAWGSGGTFSIGHVLEDASSALDFMSDRGNAETYRHDPGRIALIGHSMGGFAALQLGARDDRALAVAALAPFNLGAVGKVMCGDPSARALAVERMRTENTAIRGATGESLAGEMIEHADEWDLVSLAARLSRKPVLLALGERDEISVPAVHHEPLWNAYREERREASLTEARLDDDHYFSCRRIALGRRIIEWLGSLA